MRDADGIDERTFLFPGKFERALKIVHSIQEPGHGIPKRLSSNMSPLAIDTAAIVIEIGKGAQVQIVFRFQVLFQSLNRFFGHVQPAFLKSASMTSSVPVFRSCWVSGCC